MTRLNKYVLMGFLKPLVFGYTALALLVMMADVIERLDKLIAGKAKPLLVFNYLLALWPVRSQELLPVAGLLATLFVLGQLSRRQEITAALSGGIHPWRLTAPLWVSGIVLSILSWGLGETVVPWASRRAKTLWNVEIRQLRSFRPTLFENVAVAGPNTFYSIGQLDLAHNTMERVLIENTVNGSPVRLWQARKAQWASGAWTLLDGVERTFTPDAETPVKSRFFKEEKIDLTDKPDDLVPREPDTQEMNQKDLSRHIRRLKSLGLPTAKLQVEWHGKVAFPWANLIVMLIGIPFAFNRRVGKVRSLGLALAVAFGYFGLMQVGRALGQQPNCPPMVGAWLGNALFMIVASRLFWKMKSL